MYIIIINYIAYADVSKNLLIIHLSVVNIGTNKLITVFVFISKMKVPNIFLNRQSGFIFA